MVTTTRLTAADLAAMDEDGYRDDLIAGELVRMMPAGGVHGEIGVAVSSRLWLVVDQGKLGRVYGSDTGFKVAQDPDTVLSPDAAFVRADRVPPYEERIGFLPLAPDLAVEIVSPSDREPMVSRKIAAYQAAGTPLLWVFRTEPRTVTVHTLDHPPRVLGHGDDLVVRQASNAG